MNSIFKKYIPFLQEGDYFFVIEIFGSIIRGSLILVQPTSKQVQVISSKQALCEEANAEAFTRVLPELVKQSDLPATTRVLALLDHRRAAVVSAPIVLMRSDSRSELRQAELENLVSQGLWKLVNMHRPVAAAAMGIPETRVRLADADVMQIKLDGHRVVNPIGFTARAVELWYRETFVDEVLLKHLANALTEDNLSSVVEAPAMLAQLIARVRPQESFLFVSVGAEESLVYHVDHLACAYVDSFHWGTETLLGGVAHQFGTTRELTSQLLSRYGAKQVSPAVRKAIEAAASGELAILSNGIAAHQPKTGDLPVYVHGAVSLPEFLFDNTFTRRLGLSLSLTEVNEHFIGEQTGFVVQLQKSRTDLQTRFTFDAVLAVIADMYAASAAPLVSKAVKQRARWGSISGTK
jgi:hypothetical protein